MIQLQLHIIHSDDWWCD